MNLSLCLFDEAAVQRFVAHCHWDFPPVLTQRPVCAGQSPAEMHLAGRAGGAHAVGHFYRPVSNPEVLLFTSNSEDGWTSLLHCVSQLALTQPVAGGHTHWPGHGLAPWHTVSAFAKAGFVTFRICAQPLLLEFSLHLGLHTQRLVRLMDDDRARLDWFEEGQPLSLEDSSRYQARRKRDRLNVPLLGQYARGLGLDGLSERDFSTLLPSLTAAETWPR